MRENSKHGFWQAQVSAKFSHSSVGAEEGVSEGDTEGVSEGLDEGDALGLSLGLAEGVAEGSSLGLALGEADGTSLGLAEGVVDGKALGIHSSQFLHLVQVHFVSQGCGFEEHQG